jgi:hypothetical protein
MKAEAIVFFCCSILWSVFSHAKDGVEKQVPAIVVKYAPVSGETLQLQVAQAPLRKVFDELSRVTEIGIHYSVLADELVTATCVGDSLKKVLECLLDDLQNIVFQYSQDTVDAGKVGKPVDIWILGSSLAGSGKSGACNGMQNGSVAISKKQHIKQVGEKLIARLMHSLASNEPRQRADAIADLAIKTAIDNADVDDALLHAMDDKASIVREQALFGWAYRKGKDASAELRQALQDTEMSVRMKVVDLTQDRALLAQATADSNEIVRKIAQMKLDELESQTNEN